MLDFLVYHSRNDRVLFALVQRHGKGPRRRQDVVANRQDKSFLHVIHLDIH